MAIQPEVWIRDLQENLYHNNPHIMRSVDHSEFLQNAKVHVPQSGADPNVVKDRTNFPAPINDRTDDILSYDIHEFTTGPILVRNLEQVQRSYNKRQSVLRQHQRTLNQRLGLEAIHSWSVSGDADFIVRTSGAGENVRPTGATGTRKAIKLADIYKMMEIFDENDIPRDGRYLMLHPGMYRQLLEISDVQTSDKMGMTGALPDGVINNLAGFNIMVRGQMPIYDNSTPPVLQDIGATVSSTDNLGAIAWHEDFVARAPGDIDVFLEERKPTYYGDVMSALAMFGSSKLRKSNLGLGAIVQGQ